MSWNLRVSHSNLFVPLNVFVKTVEVRVLSSTVPSLNLILEHLKQESKQDVPETDNGDALFLGFLQTETVHRYVRCIVLRET